MVRLLLLLAGLLSVAVCAQRLKIRSRPRVTALMHGHDMVYVGGYLAAFAERVIEQDAAAQHLPAFGVVDLLVPVGLAFPLLGVALAAATVDSRAGALLG